MRRAMRGGVLEGLLRENAEQRLDADVVVELIGRRRGAGGHGGHSQAPLELVDTARLGGVRFL
jgi:hypothetical protein